jgi:hypothetical protein
MGSHEACMSSELYACIHAAEFPAQALLRLRTDLQTHPVAVLDGPAPQETVCSLNRHAVQQGAVLGMTRLEAEGLSGLQLLPRSFEVETAAHTVLLESAAKFSPRIEEASDGTGCALVLDITGTELLFGPPEKLAGRLRDEVATAGFRVSIATSANFHAAHTFQPIEEEFCLKEFCDFDTPVDQIDSLLFIGARMIDCLAARAATHALSLASLVVEMKLAGGLTAERTIRPAIPTVDRKFLLKLLQLEIAAHPPQAEVHSLALTAEAGQSSKVQLGLFAPQTPEPSRLDVTIARLKAIAGEDRVGSPVLEDSHRPGRLSNGTLCGRESIECA